jgi:hypothetical protein
LLVIQGPDNLLFRWSHTDARLPSDFISRVLQENPCCSSKAKAVQVLQLDLTA